MRRDLALVSAFLLVAGDFPEAAIAQSAMPEARNTSELPPVRVTTPEKKKKNTSQPAKKSVTERDNNGPAPSALADKTPKDPASEGVADYVVTQSVTGAKVPTSILDIPQSVAVVPKKIIEEQDPRSVTAAAQNVAGVSSAYPSYYPLDYMNSLYVRGFQVSATLRDGMWDPTPQGNSWLGNVQRIEVVKGPAGLLNGVYTGDIGGIINIVTKKPTEERAYTFEETVDSFGTRTVKVDINQPISQNWAMRVNLEEGVYENFPNRSEYEKRAGSVVLQGKITPDDTVLLSYEKRWQEAQPYSGTPGYVSVGSGASATLFRLPQQGLSFNFYDPRSYWTFESDTVRAEYTHSFNSNWTFRSAAQYTTTARSMVSITASPIYSAGTVKYRESYSEIHMGPVEDIDTDNLINGKFALFGFNNDLTVGVRYTKDWFDMNMSAPTTSFSTYTFTDINNPAWYKPIVGLHRSIWGYSEMSQINGYVNELLSITSKLKLSAGFNYTDYNSWSQSGMSASSQSGSGVDGDGTAKRIGLIYEMIPGTALFADYATTFKPQGNNVTTDGTIQQFSPLQGDQYEIGVKTDIGRRAVVTAALYQLTLENQLQSDPDPTKATLGYEVESGKTRSRGVELDGTYNVLPGWNLLTSYAYTNAKIIDSESYLVGSVVPHVPEHSFKLWTTYEFDSGKLEGLTVGGGMRAVSSSTTNLVSQSSPNLVATLPGYAEFDLMASYKIDPKWKVSLNLNNIFDRRYYESATSYTWLYPGAPFNAVLRVKTTF